jgi:phospholipid/cholesterol/gamma-HCH transport system substrate-binding protein
MRDERRNYLVAGGFVVAMLVALLVWIALLSGRMWGADPYHVHFARVHGLAAGTKVFFDGYPVGRIERIAVDEENRRFRVDLRIRDGWKVPQDSRAQVLRGIFSGVVVDIRGGSSGTPIPPGGEIPGEEGGDVFADVQSIARKFDAMLEELRPVIDGAAKGGPEIVANLRSLAADLERAGDRLGALLSTENADRVGRALANVEETSENLATLTRSLETTRAGLDGVVARVGALVDEDRGDVSEALRDLNHSLAAVARHIDAITADLETSSRNLAEFTRGVREDPGVLVRGRERAGDGSQP